MQISGEGLQISGSSFRNERAQKDLQVSKFMGPQEVKADDKGRVTLPKKMEDWFRYESTKRLKFGEDCKDLKAIIGVGFDNRPAIFPVPVFEEMMRFLDEKPKYSPKWTRLRESLLCFAEEKTVDASRRIGIPKVVGKKFKLTGDVVITPGTDRLILHNADEFYADDYDDLQGLFDELGPEMGDPGRGESSVVSLRDDKE